MGRRVLITGLGTFWGGRVAQALEQEDDVDVIVGLDREEPSVELQRTEYVRSDENYSILARIVKATKVDTIVHTFLVVDSTRMRARTMHEINVVVKSSTLVYGSSAQDPTWFKEETPRSSPPKTPVERSLLSVESYVRDFAEDNPHVNVTLLRYSNVLGPDIVTPASKALELPLVPSLFGYDPRLQFVHEDDVVRSIMFVLDHQLPGIYNVAGDGMLPWSEVAAICGKRTAPMPPFGMTLAAAPLQLVGVDLPPELLSLLKYGRGVDNRRFKRAGFRYEYTSAGTVQSFVEALRLRRTVGDHAPAYRYERDVEQFFRHSPAVVREHEEHA